jgi:hypothetical protein
MTHYIESTQIIYISIYFLFKLQMSMNFSNIMIYKYTHTKRYLHILTYRGLIIMSMSTVPLV